MNLKHIPEQEAELDLALEEIDKLAAAIEKGGAASSDSSDRHRTMAFNRQKLVEILAEGDPAESHFHDFDDETGEEISPVKSSREAEIEEIREQRAKRTACRHRKPKGFWGWLFS